MQFTASRIHGKLLFFRGIVYCRASVFMDSVAQQLIGRPLPERRIVVQVTDDFPTQTPQVIYVPTDRLRRKAGGGQMLDKRPEAYDQRFARRQVFFQPHP